MLAGIAVKSFLDLRIGKLAGRTSRMTTSMRSATLEGGFIAKTIFSNTCIMSMLLGSFPGNARSSMPLFRAWEQSPTRDGHLVTEAGLVWTQKRRVGRKNTVIVDCALATGNEK